MTEIKATNITLHNATSPATPAKSILNHKAHARVHRPVGFRQEHDRVHVEHALVQAQASLRARRDNIRFGLNNNLGFTAADRERTFVGSARS